MTKLYLIGGVPGAGKSTLAQRMISNGQADVHLEADMFMMENGEYKFDPKKLKYAHEQCQEQSRLALSRGKTVVVANTFTTRWERETYEMMAALLGADYEFIKVDGGFKSIHGVPEEKIQQMRARWED